VSEEELLAEVERINADADIDGLIVQLPIPDHISVEKVTDRIKPEKDVDGFHPVNVGRMGKKSSCLRLGNSSWHHAID
jgi:methylenetetrahydrofolate dehydrogenase (NADP+)/methenyltetrahydrofolate cyclohydrolase